MNHVMKHIDPKLAARGFNNIAKIFVCKKCMQVPFDFYKCTDRRCEEVVCSDCKIGDKCSTCQRKLPSIAKGDLKELFELINFKCPNSTKDCTSIVRLKNMQSHFEECSRSFREREPSSSYFAPAQSLFSMIANFFNPNIPTNNSSVKPISEKKLLNKKLANNADLDEFQKNHPKKEKLDRSPEDSAYDLEKKAFLSSFKENIKNDNFFVNVSFSNLAELDKEYLKEALLHRGLSCSGTKVEMAYKLLGYVRMVFYTDAKLVQLIKKHELESLLNEELEDILETRGLKKGGNKEEKMKTLKMYLNMKKNL